MWKQLLLLIVLPYTAACAPASVKPVPAHQLTAHIQSMGIKPSPTILHVDTQEQKLNILHNNRIIHSYIISTSSRGNGEQLSSFKTPRGLHRINEKIGDGIPEYGIFRHRRFTSVWQQRPRTQHFKDYVSTRILRLEGLQTGFNRGKNVLGQWVDTEQRAVYIHGTTMEWKLGFPSTKGCVHMSAKDVIHLFNQVPVGTLVWIY